MIYFLYILLAFSIIYCSYFASKYIDMLDKSTSLSGAFIGGILLSAITSLPEMSSTVSLFKINNFNVATGIIVGSNLFNFIILSVTDLFYTNDSVYSFSDPKNVTLLIFGITSLILTPLCLKTKNKPLRLLFCVLSALCYLAFIAI